MNIKKKLFLLFALALCLVVPVFAACGSKNDRADAPRFDGMSISAISPLSAAYSPITSDHGDRDDDDDDDGRKHWHNRLPKDDMPVQSDADVDIKDDAVSDFEKEAGIDADEANASARFYAEVDQDVYITVSLINPKSYSILRFTLNGVVYQSYQFESGSTSAMLVLKVNSGSVCGVKEFTIDEIKYVDDNDGNKIKDAIISGNRSVKLNVAYDKSPTVEPIGESMSYTSYSAEFFVSDPYGLADYDGGVELQLYDGVKKIHAQPLVKGSNAVRFDDLVMGKTYKCLVIGLYDRCDAEGYCAHVMYENDVKPSAFCAFTDVTAGYDSIDYNYKVLNDIADIIGVYLVNGDGQALDAPAEGGFTGLTSNTKYQLRIYYGFTLDGAEHVFFDRFNVSTKAYPVPSVSATYSVRETAVDFDVHIDDDYGLLEFTGIKLYDRNGGFVAAADVTARTIEGLSRNMNYVLKFFYTYDLKDGRGAIEGERAIAFSTSKAVPVVDIRPYAATQTSLQFDLIVTDPNVVGRINSIRLYRKDGNVFVNELLNTALRTFEGLAPDTRYVLEVGYIYDMDDGNGSRVIKYTADLTTAKRVPTCAIDVTPAYDSLRLAVNEVDPDDAGELASVCVYDGATLVKKIENISALMTVDGLYSDREYTVVGEYKYNIEDYSQADKAIEVRTAAKTYAKPAPQITVTDGNATYSSFDYAVTVADEARICTVNAVKLMLGTVEVCQTTDTSGAFDGLYSNNKYTVEVHYGYDLNDGAGVRNAVYRKDVRTAKRDDVSVAYADMRAYANSIKYGYDITDKDGLLAITAIELFDADGALVQSQSDLNKRTFEGLDSEAFYTITTTYSYDMGDGAGVRTDKVSIKYGTSGSKLFVNSLAVLNNNPPSVGEEVHVRLSLDNPHGLDVSAVYISGVRCEVLNNSSDLSDVIVKFVPETEGGRYTVEVTGYEYVTGGITLADDLVSEYKQDIIVMGELSIVDYFAVSDDQYLNLSKSAMRILEIYNPTGYEIYSLTYVGSPDSNTADRYSTTTDFTVIDKNHLLVKELGRNYWNDYFRYRMYHLALCGITYGIEGTTVSATFDYIDAPVMIYDEEVHISTPDDLLSMATADNYYESNKLYILDNDIDMSGVKWSGVSGSGVFDGRGHTISNLAMVIEDEGTTKEYYGLFKQFNGVIHDLNLKDVYYSVTTNSSDLYVGGIAASNAIVKNSSVSGTIRVKANGGYVSGVVNSNYNGNDTRGVSTNNYVENLQIIVSGDVRASMLYYGNVECRVNFGTNRSYDYTYSIGELNSMILGRSFVQNADTGAVSHPYYMEDTSGPGGMYVDKTLHNVTYTFETNCDTVQSFKRVGVSVTSIDAVRKGYVVDWYDDPDYRGDPVVLPYMSEEDATLYARWTRMTDADPRYTYEEVWPWDQNTRSNYRAYVVRDFGEAAKTDKSFVIGGYYKDCPVIGFNESAFDFITYAEDADGNRISRDWDSIRNMVGDYSLYLTYTVQRQFMNGTLYAANVYFEANPLNGSDNNWINVYSYDNFTLHVSSEYYSFYSRLYADELQYNGSFRLVSFTQGSSPFAAVVKPAATDEKSDRIAVVCADANNLKQSTKVRLEDMPYTYYTKDGYRWLDYNGTQFVVIDNNLYAGIESIVEDDLFRYIIYTNGDVTIDALLAPTTARVDLTALPYTVTAIGDNAFADSKVRTIILNEGLREIGSNAFARCSNLAAVEFPQSLRTVGVGAFRDCTSLQRLVMNDGITKIEQHSFQNSNLKEIVWSKGLKEIASYAFAEIHSYADFILPEGLETIGEWAFGSSGANIYIPASVKSIARYGIGVYEGRIVYAAAEKKLSGWASDWIGGAQNKQIYWNVKDIKSNDDYKYLVTNNGEVVVLECLNKSLASVRFDFAEGDVTEIAQRAFSGVDLREITLPDTLKRIGESAFGNSNNLKYVLIPASVTEIGTYAFYGNVGLFSMSDKEHGGWAEDIAARMVLGCRAVERNDDFVYVREINGIHIVDLTKTYSKTEVNLTVGDHTTLSVGNGLFEDNTFITSAVIPEGVERIGVNAFRSCHNLKTLVVPSTVVSIGNYAFYNCYNLTGTLYLSENVVEIGLGAIPNNREYAVACAAAQKPDGWNNAWYGNSDNINLVSTALYWNIAEVHADGTETYNYLVTADGKIVIIGVNDKNITEIDFSGFGGDVTEIGYYAFYGCNALTGVVLPETVATVRACAFNNCSRLKYVYVPASVTDIAQNAFRSGAKVLTPRTENEYVDGWNSSVWSAAVKSVTSYRIEGNTLYYTVAGSADEQTIAI